MEGVGNAVGTGVWFWTLGFCGPACGRFCACNPVVANISTITALIHHTAMVAPKMPISRFPVILPTPWARNTSKTSSIFKSS